ncbi:MAG: DUF2069 domain-containing protein [Gammaproteobacteria bacterium]
MNSTSHRYYLLTLAGYFSTMIIILVWYGWLAPPRIISPAAAITLLALPLFAALRGMLNGKMYTITWSLFLSMMYFTHGVIEAWTSPEARLYAFIEIAASLCWLVAGTLYVRAVKSGKPD